MTSNKSYFLFDGIVLRSPLYPINKFYETDNPREYLKFMEKCFTDSQFKNGILLSSYDLYNEIDKFLNNPDNFSRQYHEKLFHTFYKYFTRVCSRPTPFGLFSNLTCLSIDNHTEEVETTCSSEKSFAQIEVHFDLLDQISTYLSKTHTKFCHYRLNSSLTFKSGDLQYAVAEIVKGKNIFKTKSIEINEIIEYLVSNKNKEYQYSELISSLCQMFSEYSSEDIEAYIQDCIQEEVFYPTTRPSGRGELSNHQFIYNEIKRINKLYFSNELELILQIFNDVNSLTAHSDLKKEIDNICLILYQLNIPYSLDRILFVNAYKETELLPITSEQINTFMNDAINVLTRFTTLESSDNWYESFQQAFKSIYGDEMISFNVVFDPIIGLDYPLGNKKDRESEVLLSEIDVLVKPRRKDLVSDKQKFWFEKYIECINMKEEEIEISEKDVKEHSPVLPPQSYTFPMLISVVKDIDTKNTNPYLFIKRASTGSAISYLGRFASTNPEIAHLCNDIFKYEEKLLTDKIYAEITHIPDSKIGDILFHKSFHKYEIPYLVQSKSDDTSIINIEDLYLGIENEEFVIFSKKHNKYVIPILSNAYNFSLSEHPAFMFLCDHQHRKSFYSPNLPLGNWINDRPFFPRIRYKNLIFMPKTWNLYKGDFSEEILNTKNKFIQRIKEITPVIPTRILLGQGDQQLLIDLDNEFSCDLFYTHCRKKFINNISNIVISEFYEPISDFANELLLSYGYQKE